MYNLKNEQNRDKLIDTEKNLLVADSKGVEEMSEKGEGIKTDKLPAMKAVSGAGNAVWCQMGTRLTRLSYNHWVVRLKLI